MKKTGFFSKNIYSTETFEIENCTSLSVSNYGISDISVTISNVTRVLPAYDPILKNLFSFNIEGDGTCSDITIVVETIDTPTRTHAVLDYKKIINYEAI